ncbi:MAG: trypsin-like peptidase domain-containing protein [bacterium]|nr:trypsin-like peptidase domain-containing protein [bacterium]
MEYNFKKTFIAVIVTSIIVSSVVGGAMGFWAGALSGGGMDNLLGAVDFIAAERKVITINEESAVIAAAEKVSPAVVSIIITRDLPNIRGFDSDQFGSDFFRRFFGDAFPDLFRSEPPDGGESDQGGTTRQEIGGGTGFIVSADGYIVTNKHVIADSSADYTVLMNDGSRHAAKVLAQDPLNDLAVLKIEAGNLPTVELGDSLNLKVGQTVIAIGNALGEFRNTVSTGVISGLARSITAAGGRFGSEQLTNVIQTDASINPGNSGGPLLNIAGQVIGINTAIVQGAQNIGFAIPINEVKNSITSVKQTGRIVRPWLGVRYTLINQAMADANNLSVNYGALIVRGQNQTDLAVIPGSPADKAGLQENDIILEINGQKIDEQNPLANLVAKLKPGDEITLKVLHQGEEKTLKVRLEEMKQ